MSLMQIWENVSRFDSRIFYDGSLAQLFMINWLHDYQAQHYSYARYFVSLCIKQ